MRYYIFVDRNNKPHPKSKAKEFVSFEDAWLNCPDRKNYVLALGTLEELENYKQTNGSLKQTGVVRKVKTKEQK